MIDVIINGLQLKKNSSGIGGLIRELLLPWMKESKTGSTIVVSKDSPIPSSFEECISVVRTPILYNQGIRRVFFQSFLLGRKYCKNKILLTVDSKIPLILPKSTVILPIITDLALYRLPETYQNSRLFLWKQQYKLLKKRTEQYIAISKCTKEDMVELLNIPEHQIEVIYCAASPIYQERYDDSYYQSVQAKYKLPTKYLLFVGNFNPRKNLERMIQAYDRIKEQGFDYKFVIVGEHGWKFTKDSALSQLKHKEDVIFLGYVPDEDMPAVYKYATLFLFATLYEGFGIPVIEAQQCGTPVVVSSNSAFLEVASSESAVFVNPLEIDDISNGIMTVLRDEKKMRHLVEAGYINAKRFSWGDSAEKLEALVERMKDK